MNIHHYRSIQRLVDRYYQGLTTPAQERRLIKFFSDTPAVHLPPELEAEAPVFRAMALYMPQDHKKTLSRPRPAIFIAITAAAAAVILAVTLALQQTSMQQPAAVKQTQPALAVAQPSPTDVNKQEITAIQPDTTTVNLRPSPTPYTPPVESAQIKPTQPVEITDPEQVREILLKATYKVSQSVDKGLKTCRRLQNNDKVLTI